MPLSMLPAYNSLLNPCRRSYRVFSGMKCEFMNGGHFYQFMIGIYVHDGCDFRLVLTAVMHESAQTELTGC